MNYKVRQAMKVRTLLPLLVVFSFSSGYSQSLPDPSSDHWYVLMGKNTKEEDPLCFANIVKAKYKDATYVEPEAIEDAERREKVVCEPIELTPDQKKRMETAQNACAKAADRMKAAPSEQESKMAMAQALSTCMKEEGSAWLRTKGGASNCAQLLKTLERAKRLTVTKRLGPYPTDEQAADKLREEGWKKGLSRIGNPIWQAENGC